MGWYQRRCCCGGVEPIPMVGCNIVSGNWLPVSGTWTALESPFWTPTYKGARCSSPGMYLFTPTSPSTTLKHFNSAIIETTGDFEIALIFDAVDENNYHCYTLTRTSGVSSLKLEEVTAGVATTLDEWQETTTLIGSYFNFSVSESFNYVACDINTLSFNTFLPRDASYTRKNGTKVGYLVRSQDSDIDFTYRSTNTFSWGTFGYQSSFCVVPKPAMLNGFSPYNYEKSAIPFMGWGTDISLEWDIAGFAKPAFGDPCPSSVQADYEDIVVSWIYSSGNTDNQCTFRGTRALADFCQVVGTIQFISVTTPSDETLWTAALRIGASRGTNYVFYDFTANIGPEDLLPGAVISFTYVSTETSGSPPYSGTIDNLTVTVL